jgi:hypothetical protein
MHKSATKCNETLGKWCKNKHGASKIIDTLETYQSADGGAGGGVFIGGGGGGACARRGALVFTFFVAGPPAPAAIGGRFDTGTFLLCGARALPGACAAAALVCSVRRGGTKRARAAMAGLPVSLGFVALGGGTTEDAAVAEGGME